MSQEPCTHPDYALVISYSGGRSNPHMFCTECKWSIPVRDHEDFVKQRELKLMHDEGKDASIKRDMFGIVIEVGSMVVYPTLSGRSATLSYGEVIEINPPTKAYGADTWSAWSRRVRADAPDRIKVQPRPYTSRWKSWRGADMKVVTLTANAPSVVVMP